MTEPIYEEGTTTDLKPTTPKVEKVPFTKCLLHETKKATKSYIVWIATVIDLFAAVAMVAAGLYYAIIPSVCFIIDILSRWNNAAITSLTNLWTSTTAYHIPVAVLLLVVSPPIIYALAICIARRIKGTMWEDITLRFVASACGAIVISTIIALVADFMIYITMCLMNHGYYIKFEPVVSWLWFVTLVCVLTVCMLLIKPDNLYNDYYR